MYQLRFAKLRFGEFHRMAGIAGVLQAAVFKVVARGALGGNRMKLPDRVTDNLTPEAEVEPAVLARLQAIERGIPGATRLFHVTNKTSQDTQNHASGGGVYLIIDAHTLGFCTYIRTQNLQVPSVVIERETFVCTSASGGRIHTTSNFDIGFDAPPEIDALRLRGASPQAVIARHRARVPQGGLMAFSADDHQTVVELIDRASAYSAEDKVRRGLYQLVEALE